ncbi:hypothetical protein KS08_15775 [Bacillus subtilis]|nr:hypothetical protein BAMTA208_16025 [Bacillus amyloliquefaciens TA208]AIW35018.1 hypothetical protein KS08_15775 [Bacillus subtilis]
MNNIFEKVKPAQQKRVFFIKKNCLPRNYPRYLIFRYNKNAFLNDGVSSIEKKDVITNPMNPLALFRRTGIFGRAERRTAAAGSDGIRIVNGESYDQFTLNENPIISTFMYDLYDCYYSFRLLTPRIPSDESR